MKWVIASDIHGSVFWSSKMLNVFETEKADRILLLGDILYHGPRNDLPYEYNPKEVARLLNEYASVIYCVRGNCDSEVDQMMLDFPILAEYLIVPFDNFCFFASHGHKYDSEIHPPLKERDILIGGHTHIASLKRFASNYYVNPGSVSIPKNGAENSLIVFNQDTFQWKNFEGRQFMELCLNGK